MDKLPKKIKKNDVLYKIIDDCFTGWEELPSFITIGYCPINNELKICGGIHKYDQFSCFPYTNHSKIHMILFYKSKRTTFSHKWISVSAKNLSRLLKL